MARKPTSQKPAEDEAIPAVVEPEGAGTELLHPKEGRASVEVQFASGARLKATARWTPASMITSGMMISGILLSVASVIWASRRRP
jgi:hypothetical protein